MCGHVGIAGKMEFRDEATMKRLLLLDYFRGTDSTGLAAIRKTGDADIAKIASHPIDLFDSKAFEGVLNAFKSTAFIGHNRAATKGKVNGHNAHPYAYGHIVGAHNGTLDAFSWKDLNTALGYETDVDSMAIFAHIEKFGIEETVKLLRGAWALVWVNLADNTLNFLRNKERPMWYGYTEDFSKIIWASEWPMIQSACQMAPKTYEYKLHRDQEGYTYFPMDTDLLYTFDLEELAAGSNGKLPEPILTELKGKEPLPVVTYNHTPSGSPFTGSSGTQSKTTTSNGGTNSPKEYPVVVNIETSEKRPFARFVNELEFEEMAKGGCTFCGGDVDFTEEGVVIFEATDQVLCPSCSGHSVTRYMATPNTYNTYLNPPKKEVA